MKKFMICLSLFVMMSSIVQGQWLWDRNQMIAIKKELHTASYAAAYASLITSAEQEMLKKPYSVTQKKGIAPSGDKHDYVSLSRYWWPNPEHKDGMPYIFKDGQSNPELAHYDRNTLGDMCAAVQTLGLAYFYSGEEKYAQKAVNLLQVWFLNANTKMNPNLEYSQFIPGRDNSKGRPEGLIDSYSFVGMLSSVALLKESAFYLEQDDRALKQWFADFSNWLQHSEQGVKENHAKNNHATAYDAQLISYLLFAGKETEARKIIMDFPQKRIYSQIEPDGSQPQELWRTLSYHYSWYNLSHMLDVCATAQKLGINLLEQRSADGRSIYQAMDYLSSFLGKDVEAWPYKQISGWEAKQQDVCQDLLRMLALDPTLERYQVLYERYAKPSPTDRRILLYGN